MIQSVKWFMFRFLFLLVLMVGGCDQKQSRINELAEELNAAEVPDVEMSEMDWQKLSQAMEELDKELIENRSEFTEAQVEEVNKLKGKYAALIVKKGLNDFQESLKDIGEQMEGFIEEITDSTTNQDK